MNNWEQISSIVDRALDLDPDEQIAFVDDVCGNDEALKANVIHFLDSVEPSDGLWDKMVESGSILVNEITTSDVDIDGSWLFSPLKQAGPYRVLELIARGGMGNVYLAERSDGQFERKVAIKILRHELSSKNHVNRFLAERNILSGLEHPNIARLYDGGITDDNRPYLVMEYVDGLPITTYCKENGCALKEILDLFKQVCKAVEYAHRNLIVHRDLKPDNILVKPDGTVKILDFGIAKILDDELSPENLVLTKENLHMLSIQYAAPEQVTLERITTATDVYALGLLLYEMITGRPPFDLKGKKLEEAEQVIRFEKPENPSKIISDRNITKKVKGDIDAIVLTALQKKPDLRYRRVDQLLDDVNCYMDDLPISVRSNGWRYRIIKFTRRRPWVIAAGITGFMVTMGYLIILQTYTDQLQTERNIAQIEAEKAEIISDFVIMLFESNDPDFEDGNLPTVFELLERGVQRAELLEDRPEISAQMLEVIAQMYDKLAQYQLSEPIYRQVVDIRRTLYSEPHADLAASLDRLGDTLLRSGYLDEAEEILIEAIEIAHAVGDPVIEADAINDLGLVHYKRGNYRAAEENHIRALELRREALGESHHRVGTSLNNLAVALEAQGRMDEAEKLYLQSLSVKRESLSDDHSDVTLTLAQLGRIYSETGNHEKAEPLLTQALESNRRRLGPQHPRIAADLNDLAALYSHQHKYQMAEELFREALDILEATQVVNTTRTAIAHNNVAQVLAKQNLYSDAYPLSIKAVEIARETWGNSHMYTAHLIYNLAYTQKNLELYDQAEAHFIESISMMKNTLAEDHPLTANPLIKLGELLTITGRAEEAEPYLREALKLRVQANSDQADIAQAQFNLGFNLAERSLFEEAETLLRNSLETRIDVLGQDHPDVIATQSQLNEILQNR
jgi:eukaryotic-like serine/threonine-protein kinase